MLKGFYRIAAGVPELHLANPAENAREIEQLYNAACAGGAAILVLPELALTGCTCGDLLEQRQLLEAAESALGKLVEATRGQSTIMAVGLPVLCGSALHDCVAVLQNGEIHGLTARRLLAASRGAACGLRHFTPAATAAGAVDGDYVELCGQGLYIGSGRLYDDGDGFRFGIEVGDEGMGPGAPSEAMAAAGATLIVNAGAWNEVAGQGEWLRQMVAANSARLNCAYCMASAGMGESTTDGLFGGRALIADCGEVLAQRSDLEAEASENRLLWSEFSPAWVHHRRRAGGARKVPSEASAAPIVVELSASVMTCGELRHRFISPTPFVPPAGEARARRCREILSIQAAALARRVRHTHSRRLVLGLSGGLDSTLALMVCVECCRLLKEPTSFICALTLPGMGTTGRTYANACGMARQVGAELREVSIKAAVQQHFADIGHDPANLNVVYENSQARERTQILMDVANEVGGLVIGTGDLSEIALGWCTYNGDHMSMYAVNSDVPKSLIRWMVEYCADRADEAGTPDLAAMLRDVNATPVSPELLPGGAGEQKTEGILGSYSLHDFILYYFIRHGETPENIRALAGAAFQGEFSEKEIADATERFMKRFFGQQFKRSCSVDGPKVGTVALSPRGEWQMPSDAAAAPWLR